MLSQAQRTSAAARKKIAAAQRTLWAKWKKNKRTKRRTSRSMRLFSMLYVDFKVHGVYL
jgi:hypothetical protein